MLSLYRQILNSNEPFLVRLLKKRQDQGKEDPHRLQERMGHPSRKREKGVLIWLHGASIGEAQTALIVVEHLQTLMPSAYFLITSGTLTSAHLIQKRVSGRIFHQYIPLDHPAWIAHFLDHWKPDMALWMESELWPNILGEIKKRNIPSVLINARLSKKSFTIWRLFQKTARSVLSAFSMILAQTQNDADHFTALGGDHVQICGNVKYSAAPLGADGNDLRDIKSAIAQRPILLYTSTHDGEEDMAADIHLALQKTYPGLLSIIAPRHPNRADKIRQDLGRKGLAVSMRGDHKNLPQDGDDIYLSDTLGELGLYYSLAPFAFIGRSLSRDGGGGHNPIEAAQLGCGVLYGPNVQYQQEIYDQMGQAGAAIKAANQEELKRVFQMLLGDENEAARLQKNGLEFAQDKKNVIDDVIHAIKPLLVSSQCLDQP